MNRVRGYRREIETLLITKLKGNDLGSLEEYEKFAVDFDEEQALDLGPLEALFGHLTTDSKWTVKRPLTDEEKNELDGWLAPRLHAAVRVHRALAADPQFWTWLTLAYGRGYMEIRWPTDPETVTSAWRYTGGTLRNGLARLWWGAEMVRSGDDYQFVAPLFRRTRTAQFALELSYSHYRPAAIAFVKVAENYPIREGAPRLNDEEMKGLSKKINAALSLNSLEARAAYDLDDDPTDEWYRMIPKREELLNEELPQGPPSSGVPAETLNSLEDWFRSLL
ncbi:DUF6339 family protein [Deinococcus sedimenti]|uniref:Uncharacterized protein n=1 Tax=Deinococcus sedimenti TaxID=1867090 RepID=A0ABQ2SB43_9DEIO|nr:DUF6339 family protein [Deinococcus sedimenti]GGS05757.1 hypothetical protein GCM10008960_35330 [Deinococcus sedimenti]